MAPTPLSASAPTLRNWVGVGKLNEARWRLCPGGDDGLRVNEVGEAGGIGVVLGKRCSFCCCCCSCNALGTYAGVEGDESGVNKPFPRRYLGRRDSGSSQLDVEHLRELGRLSRDEDAARQEVDVFGLGTGEEVGVRRGDGSGNS